MGETLKSVVSSKRFRNVAVSVFGRASYSLIKDTSEGYTRHTALPQGETNGKLVRKGHEDFG
jgi:hypothetical protein